MTVEAKNTIAVRVGSIPGNINEIRVPSGTSVSQALTSAGISTGQDSSVRLNNKPVTEYGTTMLQDGDNLIVTRNIRGNLGPEKKQTMMVRVGSIPGNINQIEVQNGLTVRQVLEQAGLEVGADKTVRIDNRVANLDDVVPEGTVSVMVTQNIRGNA